MRFPFGNPAADECVLGSTVNEDAAGEAAAFGLARSHPELSAGRVVSPGQISAASILVLATIAALFAAPFEAALVLFWLATLVSATIAMFRAGLTLLGDEVAEDIAVPRARSTSWPVYSVLVPLYREAMIAPVLVQRLRALSYPADRLDVIVLTEADDVETCAAVLGAIAGDDRFRMISAPPIGPRTKPKALNYGLAHARGDYVAVFDAEDHPEPEQLRKAVLRFEQGGETLACLQASLNFYNARRNALTRLFALEYAQLFDHVLPGLVRLRAPVPLGGTSNHFRMTVLKACGAWDPFNVTEDADLGVRLARAGYSVSTLPSITYEEATAALVPWYKQRSRWLKGYMQTWLVHMRAPLRLYRELGPAGFVCFQLFVGGAVFAALINPWLWTVLLCLAGLSALGIAVASPIHSSETLWLLFVLPNGILLYSTALSALKRGWHDLIPWALLGPFYWILQSAAGYRALWQLVTDPFYWDKTQHGSDLVAAPMPVPADAEAQTCLR